MNYRVRLIGLMSRRTLPSVALTAFLLLHLAVPLWAEDGHYLAPGHPDGVALLAPPPVAGSGEEAADLAAVRTAFKARTPAEELQAKKEDAKLSIDLFEPAIGSVFESGKLPQTESFLKKVRKEMSESVKVPKEHWKRLRPYQLDAALTFDQPEKSFSYPSGHSAWGTVHALILAELFPEKRDAILAIGRDIGWHRVLIGKHFLTDVRAGRVLGQAIVREMSASPAFQHDLAVAKAEVQAAVAQMAGK